MRKNIQKQLKNIKSFNKYILDAGKHSLTLVSNMLIKYNLIYI